MKKALLPAILFLFCNGAFAANTYRAYIIQLNRDTVHGFIIVEKPETLHWQISFEDSSGKSQVYKPGAIAGFAINMDGDWRRFVIIDVGEPVAPGSSGSLVFARVMNDQGAIKLYKYNYYKEKPGYYRNDIYVKGDRVLITENSLVKENNQVLRLQERSGVFTSNKKQLKNFFKDCPEAVAKTEQVKDIWYEMPSLVQAYNLCKKNKVFLP